MSSSASWFGDEDALVRELRRGRTGAAPRLQINGYEDFQELRRGGQGVVFLARQTATRRTVAIKVLLDGALATPKARQRFEREVDLVAGLRHPNIVRVYDGGRTSDDRLYYVMEYIEGIGLDRLIEAVPRVERRPSGTAASKKRSEDPSVEKDCAAGLSFEGPDTVTNYPQTDRQRVEMFAKICDGVQYAHQRGVIHRDLKPSNIRIDRSGEPRVLDFGLAKLAEGSFDETALSQTGGFLGSIPWASPEQAEGSRSLVDTRSDVYSLGVVLYQLLTGEFPYRLDGSLREALDAIRLTAPQSIREIRRDLPDDLATIVSKCLSKEPARRYQSAGEIAIDLRHWLAGEPIEAKRDSAWYTVRKRLDRYRAAVWAVSGLLVLSIGFSVAMVLLRNRAIEAEHLAAKRLAEVEEANLAQVRAREALEAQVRRTDQVRAFLDTTLRAVDPWKHPGRDLGPLQEMLESAVARLEGAFPDQPEVEAEIAATLGADFRELGLHDAAEKLLRRSYELNARSRGADDPDTLRSGNELARLLTIRGRHDEAQALLEDTFDRQRRLLGPEHRDTLSTANNLALNMNWQGRSTAAAKLYRETLEAQTRTLDRLDPDRLSTLNNLSTCLVELGELDEGEKLAREYVADESDANGENHPETLSARHNLAYIIQRRGRYAEAESMMREILADARTILGPQHPATISEMHNLADVLSAQGKTDEGLLFARQAYESQLAFSGPDDPTTLNHKNELSTVLIESGRWEEAIPIARELLEQHTRVLGPRDYRTLNSAGNLAFACNKAGQKSEAERIWKGILDGEDPADEAAIPYLATTRANLAGLCADQARWKEAEQYYRAAIADQLKLGEADQWRAAFMRGGLGRVLTETGRLDEAEPLLKSSLNVIADTFGESHARTQQLITYLARLYDLKGDPDAAAKCRARLSPE